MTLPLVDETSIIEPADWDVIEMFEAEPFAELPKWMQDIVNYECAIHGQEPPTRMVEKIVRWNPYFGGYTAFKEKEIAIVYGGDLQGQPSWRGSANELEAILHETAHWLVGKEDYAWQVGGHTPRYYAKLAELCLKYDTLECYLHHEFHYMGWSEMPYKGLELFHSMYNV